MADKPNFTWGHLATALNVTRTTVTRWRRLAGSPKTTDLEQWKSFVEENDLGVAGNKPHKDREELLREKLRREIALLDVKVAKERREVVPASELNELLASIASSQRAELIRFANTEAVTIAGKLGGEVADARTILEGLVDRQCDIMETAVARFMQEIDARKSKGKTDETD